MGIILTISLLLWKQLLIMAKNKLQKFAQMKTFERVFEPAKEEFIEGNYPMKGKWGSEVFKNDNPIVLELGCGKGEYSVGLAKQYPNKNFIGIDIKGARIWAGAKQANEENIANAAFLRTNVDFVNYFFDTNEIDEVWLTFSDPQPKKANKRLSSRPFIERYKKFLKPDGIVHLKTDNTSLYLSTLDEIERHNYELIQSAYNVYETHWDSFSDEMKEVLSIKTHYERLFANKGFKIKYCSFKTD